MRKRGHEILITASEKDVSYKLLNGYGFEYVKIGSYGNSLVEKLLNIPILDYRMYSAVKKFKPDIFLGFGSIRGAHISKFLNKPCIAFDDTEHARWEHILYVPFTNFILTPVCFRKNLGKKQIRYNGYTELASLHPNRFIPNPDVLNELGITENSPFIVIRFVSWDASHDLGQHGIRDRVGMVKALEKYGRVLITSEAALPPELQLNQIRVSPEKLHDLLYYATLYLGEGGTTASEAALLGTPSIFVSSLAGSMGNFIELEETYDLLYSFKDSDAAQDRAVEILQDTASKEKWKIKKERLLKDKIDVTAFMVWFIENYPNSVVEMRRSTLK
jgi:predicted glycosyltransferase